MSEPDRLYRLELPAPRVACSTDVRSLSRLLGDIDVAPGRYEIKELTWGRAAAGPEVRTWGWAIKTVDGSVGLRAADPAP